MYIDIHSLNLPHLSREKWRMMLKNVKHVLVNIAFLTTCWCGRKFPEIMFSIVSQDACSCDSLESWRKSITWGYQTESIYYIHTQPEGVESNQFLSESRVSVLRRFLVPLYRRIPFPSRYWTAVCTFNFGSRFRHPVSLPRSKSRMHWEFE